MEGKEPQVATFLSEGVVLDVYWAWVGCGEGGVTTFGEEWVMWGVAGERGLQWTALR